MLNKINIKNFKKIRSEGGLALDNLARVNYLVGENGCGKSSIIAALFGISKYFDDNSEVMLLFTDGSSRLNSIKNGIQSFSKFIDYKSYFHDNSDLDHHSGYSEKIIVEERVENDIGHVSYGPKMQVNVTGDIYKDTDVIKTVEHFIQKEGIFSLSEVAGGYKFLYYLFDIFEKIGVGSGHKIFLFEEPECGLHPSFQKLLPSIFNYLIRDNSEFQIFITTHSPFVISAAAELVEKKFEEDIQKNGKSRSVYKKEFKPNQKVYNIENGICKQSEGSWGSKMVFESAKMLGAGMDSIIVAAKSENQIDNESCIVLCESKKGSDAKIYQIIFQDKPCIFISCDSCNDVYRQYIVTKEFYKHQKGAVKIIGIIDNDPQNINKEKWKLEGLFVLGRAEIENYLYDILVVKKLDGICNNISEEIEKCNIMEDDMKKKSIINNGLKDKHSDLAQIIYENREGACKDIYIELRDCIFGEA